MAPRVRTFLAGALGIFCFMVSLGIASPPINPGGYADTINVSLEAPPVAAYDTEEHAPFHRGRRGAPATRLGFLVVLIALSAVVILILRCSRALKDERTSSGMRVLATGGAEIHSDDPRDDPCDRPYTVPLTEEPKPHPPAVQKQRGLLNLPAADLECLSAEERGLVTKARATLQKFIERAEETEKVTIGLRASIKVDEEEIEEQIAALPPGSPLSESILVAQEDIARDKERLAQYEEEARSARAQMEAVGHSLIQEALALQIWAEKDLSGEPVTLEAAKALAATTVLIKGPLVTAPTCPGEVLEKLKESIVSMKSRMETLEKMLQDKEAAVKKTQQMVVIIDEAEDIIGRSRAVAPPLGVLDLPELQAALLKTSKSLEAAVKRVSRSSSERLKGMPLDEPSWKQMLNLVSYQSSRQFTAESFTKDLQRCYARLIRVLGENHEDTPENIAALERCFLVAAPLLCKAALFDTSDLMHVQARDAFEDAWRKAHAAMLQMRKRLHPHLLRQANTTRKELEMVAAEIFVRKCALEQENEPEETPKSDTGRKAALEDNLIHYLYLGKQALETASEQISSRTPFVDAYGKDEELKEAIEKIQAKAKYLRSEMNEALKSLATHMQAELEAALAELKEATKQLDETEGDEKEEEAAAKRKQIAFKALQASLTRVQRAEAHGQELGMEQTFSNNLKKTIRAAGGVIYLLAPPVPPLRHVPSQSSLEAAVSDKPSRGSRIFKAVRRLTRNLSDRSETRPQVPIRRGRPQTLELKGSGFDTPPGRSPTASRPTTLFLPSVSRRSSLGSLSTGDPATVTESSPSGGSVTPSPLTRRAAARLANRLPFSPRGAKGLSLVIESPATSPTASTPQSQAPLVKQSSRSEPSSPSHSGSSSIPTTPLPQDESGSPSPTRPTADSQASPSSSTEGMQAAATASPSAPSLPLPPADDPDEEEPTRRRRSSSRSSWGSIRRLFLRKGSAKGKEESPGEPKESKKGRKKH